MATASTTETTGTLDLRRWSKLPIILIAVGALLGVIGVFVDKQRFAYSYLLAYMFFLSICLGGLFLVILHHLFDANWSVPIRRINEHLACLLPVMAVLWIPIFLFRKSIFPWMSYDPHADHALHAKAALINPTAFWVVALILFALWTWLSLRFRHWSLEQDRTGSAACTRAMRVHAAYGIFVFALSLTMAAIFWMKSLQHQWFSTMYGVYYFAGSVWCTLATVYVLTMVLKMSGPLRAVATARQFHDIGVLLFAFTVFYAYIHFSQYFLIWNAAVPEETFWYVLREKGSWWDVGMLILFGHFVIPFVLLLRIDAKLTGALMVPLCIWTWLMHYLDLSFNIIPVYQMFKKALAMGGSLEHAMMNVTPDGFVIHWMDLACLAFIGGVLATVFIKYFLAHPAYPQKDPRMAEAMGVYVPPLSSIEAARGGAK